MLGCGTPALSQGKSTASTEIRGFWLRRRESTPPERQHSVPERRQARKVSWYRVVIESGRWTNRLQPSSGVGQRIVHARPKLAASIFRNLPRMRLRIVLRRTMKRPRLFFPLICVNPRKSNVSGFPSPLRFRFSSANLPNSIRRVLSGCNLALRPLLAPDVHPEIETVVQVNVGEQR